MSNIEIINKLPILKILDKLKIQYIISYNNANIIENGNKCDGRIVNIGKNYVNNFTYSKNYRAIGGPYSFTKKYLNLSNLETYKWFEANFGIIKDI